MYKQNINENYSAVSADSANPLISYLTMILVLYSRHLRQVLFKFSVVFIAKLSIIQTNLDGAKIITG